MGNYAWPSVVLQTIIVVNIIKAIAFKSVSINSVFDGDYPDHDGSASPVGDDIKA